MPVVGDSELTNKLLEAAEEADRLAAELENADPPVPVDAETEKTKRRLDEAEERLRRLAKGGL